MSQIFLNISYSSNRNELVFTIYFVNSIAGSSCPDAIRSTRIVLGYQMCKGTRDRNLPDE